MLRNSQALTELRVVSLTHPYPEVSRNDVGVQTDEVEVISRPPWRPPIAVVFPSALEQEEERNRRREAVAEARELGPRRLPITPPPPRRGIGNLDYLPYRYRRADEGTTPVPPPRRRRLFRPIGNVIFKLDLCDVRNYRFLSISLMAYAWKGYLKLTFLTLHVREVFLKHVFSINYPFTFIVISYDRQTFFTTNHTCCGYQLLSVDPPLVLAVYCYSYCSSSSAMDSGKRYPPAFDRRQRRRRRSCPAG